MLFQMLRIADFSDYSMFHLSDIYDSSGETIILIWFALCIDLPDSSDVLIVQFLSQVRFVRNCSNSFR